MLKRSRLRDRDARQPPRLTAYASEALLVAAAAGSVLAIGSVHPITQVLVTILAFAGVAVAIVQGRIRRLTPPALALLALAGYSAVQAIPLRVEWLHYLSPVAADVWSRALRPMHESVSWGSLSVDPGASLREAMKWASYAAVFSTAVAAGARFGKSFTPAVIVCVATLLALVHLAHELSGARAVYGLYVPRFSRQAHIGPLLNPNNLAGYLNLGIITALGFLVSRSTRVPRWVVALAIALMLGTEVRSASRGGLLALVMCTLLLLIGLRFMLKRRPKARLELATYGPILATLCGGLVLAWLGAAHKTWTELSETDIHKLSLVWNVVPLVQEYPLFGVGRGAFQAASPAYALLAGSFIYSSPENILVQWVSEWGIPIGLTALGTLGWLLRPSQLGTRSGTIALSATCAIMCLLLQNFVDLSSEVMSVAIAASCLLGGLYGANPARAQESNEREPPRRSRMLGGVIALTVALTGVVLLFGLRSADQERDRVNALYRDTNWVDPAQTNRFGEQLRATILRHPSDAYLARMGALAAMKARQPGAMRWIQRALECSPTDARTHYLVAQFLASRGLLSQALLELRLTATFDQTMVPLVLRRATEWSNRFEDLLNAVPPGRSGAPLLASIGKLLKDSVEQDKCFEEALRRDPTLVEPRILLASKLIQALQDPAGERCSNETRSGCINSVERHIRELERYAPRSSRSLELKARLLEARGRREEAEQVLARRCLEFTEPYTCLGAWLDVAFRLRHRGRIQTAADALSAWICASGAERCAAGATMIGDRAASVGYWPMAMTHYAHAVREAETPERHQKLASASSHMGAQVRAASALKRAGEVEPNAEAKPSGSQPVSGRLVEEELIKQQSR
jgi:tetratricopeptide (TPR) repeat protein